METLPGAAPVMYPRSLTVAIASSELDQTSVGVTIAPAVVLVVGNAGLVNPTGTCDGSLMLMDMLATSPALTTNNGAVPVTPFEAVAVSVAIPSDTPVATPLDGFMVAIDGASLCQVKFVADGLPSASTALAVTRNVVP